MKREIELAKLQLIAELFEASGVISISKYTGCASCLLDASKFYELFGDRGADQVECELISNGAHIETYVGGISYRTVLSLTIEEGQDD